jgi:hypothetical protein
MADEERLGQRDWGGDTAALGGYGSAGLYSRRRQMERTSGGSFLNISDAPNTGGVGGGYVGMPSVGPKPKETTPLVSSPTGPAGPSGMAPGVAPDFTGRIPDTPNWGQTSAVLGRAAGAAIVAGARRAMGREDKTDKDDGGNTVADQPWAAPDPKDNRTYTTNTPMTLGDDPFVGPDTDELGRPLRDISNKGVAPWGPPTGAPKHGPIFLADAASDTPKSSDGGTATTTPAAKSRREQVYASRPQSTGRTLPNRPGGRRGSGGATTEAPAQSWAPPSAADYVEPATPNEASIARDAEDPMGFFVDNSGNELPRPEPAGGQETARSTSSGRPESTGRTVPGRPGGPRLAANPNSWFSGGASEFEGAQPAATAPQSRREQVYASRPQSLGREVVGSPFRPNSVMAQRRAAAEQARVEQVSTAYEYPTAAGPPQQMNLFDQDAPSSEKYRVNSSLTSDSPSIC